MVPISVDGFFLIPMVPRPIFCGEKGVSKKGVSRLAMANHLVMTNIAIENPL